MSRMNGRSMGAATVKRRGSCLAFDLGSLPAAKTKPGTQQHDKREAESDSVVTSGVVKEVKEVDEVKVKTGEVEKKNAAVEDNSREASKEEEEEEEEEEESVEPGGIQVELLAPTLWVGHKYKASAAFASGGGGGSSTLCGSGDGEGDGSTDVDGTWSSDGEEGEDAIDHLFAELISEDIHGTGEGTGQDDAGLLSAFYGILDGAVVSPTELSIDISL